MTLETFKEYCKINLKIDLNSKQIKHFEFYLSMLKEWNAMFNLTAITDEEQIIEKHFLDSLIILKYISLKDKSLIDIGSGAGFPGVVLAIMNPATKIVLLEPNNKKARFLQVVKEKLSLGNVSVIVGRAEAQKIYREKFDFATARAVKQLNILLELAIPLLKVKGTFVAMKSQSVNEEINNAKKAFRTLNSKIVSRQEDILPTDKDIRINLFIVKNDSTPLRYPRVYGQISAKPL
ncbi:MAG: 16S rRNA (guanine(527)-N(7))-methyltransferase RsmG [Bacilli bacterium]|jgi:16S rRNA (guanine527-N7)-methyltransferase|nr:16S rRNA (guanine(527)-N(7))-methyltransferase RsmG [Bacilli bacterium]